MACGHPYVIFSPDRKRGFTLIELLVVISIIALLVGILLPALGSARSSAKITQCLARQQQVGVGIYSYANDYDGSIPVSPSMPNHVGAIPVNPDLPTNQLFAVMPINTDSRFTGAGLLLNGYLGDNRAVTCPDNTRDDLGDLAFESLQKQNADAYSSYLWRNRYAATGQFIDDMGDNPDGRAVRVLMYDFNQTEQPAGTGDSLNHAGRKVNAMYVDGHAESLDNSEGEFSLPATNPDPFGTIQSQLIILDNGA